MNKSGFTLVELLVVISIIAILSVIGITVFSGVQKSARDARRRVDINSIANAMEVNKTTADYSVPKTDQFAGGSIPHDPLTNDIAAIASGCGNDMPAGSRGNKRSQLLVLF